jgi:hypothetical protein
MITKTLCKLKIDNKLIDIPCTHFKAAIFREYNKRKRQIKKIENILIKNKDSKIECTISCYMGTVELCGRFFYDAVFNFTADISSNSLKFHRLDKDDTYCPCISLWANLIVGACQCIESNKYPRRTATVITVDHEHPLYNLDDYIVLRDGMPINPSRSVYGTFEWQSMDFSSWDKKEINKKGA